MRPRGTQACPRSFRPDPGGTCSSGKGAGSRATISFPKKGRVLQKRAFWSLSEAGMVVWVRQEIIARRGKKSAGPRKPGRAMVLAQGLGADAFDHCSDQGHGGP